MSDPVPPAPPNPYAPASTEPAVPPQYQQAPQAPQPVRKNGLGIAAMVLGIVAFVLAFIPIVNFVAGFMALVGLVLGIIALVQKNKAKTAAIIGTAASALAGILAVVMVFVYAAVFVAAVDESVRSDTGVVEQAEDPAAESEAEAPAVAQAPTVVETAFGFDGNMWWYAVVLDNANPHHIFADAEFTVEAVAADGTILDSSTEFTTLLNGPSVLVGDFVQIGAATIDHLDVRLPDAETATRAPADETGAFTTSEVTATTEYSLTELTGTVTSTFIEDQSLVKIGILGRDAAGAIVAADYTFVDRVPAGGTAQFSGMIFELPASAVTFEAIAMF